MQLSHQIFAQGLTGTGNRVSILRSFLSANILIRQCSSIQICNYLTKRLPKALPEPEVESASYAAFYPVQTIFAQGRTGTKVSKKSRISTTKWDPKRISILEIIHDSGQFFTSLPYMCRVCPATASQNLSDINLLPFSQTSSN